MSVGSEVSYERIVTAYKCVDLIGSNDLLLVGSQVGNKLGRRRMRSTTNSAVVWASSQQS